MQVESLDSISEVDMVRSALGWRGSLRAAFEVKVLRAPVAGAAGEGGRQAVPGWAEPGLQRIDLGTGSWIRCYETRTGVVNDMGQSNSGSWLNADFCAPPETS